MYDYEDLELDDLIEILNRYSSLHRIPQQEVLYSLGEYEDYYNFNGYNEEDEYLLEELEKLGGNSDCQRRY